MTFSPPSCAPCSTSLLRLHTESTAPRDLTRTGSDLERERERLVLLVLPVSLSLSGVRRTGLSPDWEGCDLTRTGSSLERERERD
jgi:hypothetical protein